MRDVTLPLADTGVIRVLPPVLPVGFSTGRAGTNASAACFHRMAALFTRFANATARWAGNPLTFIVCMGLVAVWAASGPLFGFSDTWQLVINTSTTIITFLMVFLIQNTQNRDSGAIQAKLDELIRAGVDSSNKFIGIEHLTDKELKEILDEVECYAEKLHETRRERRRKEALETSQPASGSSSTSSAKPVHAE
jgi:low affinity Fe/Cu permease